MYRVDLWMFVSVACSMSFYEPTSGARILGVFSAPARSHVILGRALLETLANEGHDVTMVNSYPSEKPIKNYRDIPIRNFKDKLLNMLGAQNMFNLSMQNPIKGAIRISDYAIEIVDELISTSAFRQLLDSDEHFDVVIVGLFLDDMLIALGHRFNAPVIVLSPIGLGFWVNGLVGNPSPYAYVPDILTGFSDRMTFVERSINTLVSFGTTLYRELYYIHRQEALLQKHFPGYPPMRTLMTNVSLIFSNSHVSFGYPRPLVPNVIEIGGFHVREPRPLPTDLQKFLDDSADGVVYFSMGSNLQSKDLPIEKRDAILATFGKLKQTVLWKWEDEEMPGKPKNVVLNPWLPQSDVLAHPNIKAFITHGGMLSTIESIHRGVPVIGIPIFGDQHSNMKRAASLGYGLMISYDNLTEVSLSWALHEILNNPGYRENVKHRSTVLRDQETDPLKKAVWWTEYVIRHRGAIHLKNASVDMPLYQYLLIDVVACIGAILLFIFVLPCYIIIKCCRRSKYAKKVSSNIAKKQD